MTRYKLKQKNSVRDIPTFFTTEFMPSRHTVYRLTLISYIQVFKCLPHDTVHNTRELKEYTAQERLCDTNPEQAREELKAVRGLLVHFPLKFLCEENLLPPLNTKEGMAPVGLWT